MENISKEITMKVRVEQLKAMHSLMLNANDENIYLSWIMGWIPDCPTEEDFIDCAENDDWYNETMDKFVKLIGNPNYRW